MSKYIEVADTPDGKKHLIKKDAICEVVETGKGCDFMMDYGCIQTEIPYKWVIERMMEAEKE